MFCYGQHLQSNFARMCIVVGTNNYNSLQFDVAGKRNVEQQFLVDVTLNILRQIPNDNFNEYK